MNACTIQSGCDVRMPIDATSSPEGSGHGGPVRASERNTPFAKPRARSGHDAHRLADRGVRRHAGDELERAQPQARRARRDRACRAAATTTRREQEVERAPHAHGAVDELGHEARGRARARRVVAQQLGQQDVRVRAVVDAYQRLERDRAWALGRRARCDAALTRDRRRVRRARRRATPRPAIARLPSGCTSSSTSTPSAVTSSAVGVDDPGSSAGSAARSGAGRAARPSPAGRRPASTHPGAGCRRARSGRARRAGRVGIEAELVDGQLLRVRRLADLRHRRRAGRSSGTCSTSNSVPTSTKRLRSSPAVSTRPDRDAVGTRTPGRCRGRPRAASRTRRSRRRPRGSPARPAPRRASAAAARSARSRTRAAALRAATTGSS